MELPGPWKVLPLRVGGGIPLLLTSFRFSNSSYSVFITDMVNVWTESLDRKQICMRGFREDTSIDPSDGEENMMAFLRSLARSFDETESEHELTNITLSPTTTSSTSTNSLIGDLPDGFTLTVTCQLPAELTAKPLSWNMYMSKCRAAEVASRLVLPLIEAQRQKGAQVASLVAMLQQKDTVINKLLDKMEAMGTPLESVFNISTNRKRFMTRDAAFTRIKGLAPFNHSSWLGMISHRMTKPADATALVEGTLQDVQLCQASVDLDSPEDMETWWLKMAPGSGGRREPTWTARPTAAHGRGVTEDTQNGSDTHMGGTGDDDVPDSAQRSPQKSRQDTPDIYRPKESSQVNVPGADDSETASEDDGFEVVRPSTPIATQASIQAPPMPSPSPVKASPVKRFGGLGKIGGRNNKSTTPSAPAAPVDGDQTMSTGETSSPPRLQQMLKTPLSKLGRIGKIGSSSRKSAVPADADVAMTQPDDAELPVPLPKSPPGNAAAEAPRTPAHDKTPMKIGRIGGSATRKLTKSPSAAGRGSKRPPVGSNPMSEETTSESDGEGAAGKGKEKEAEKEAGKEVEKENAEKNIPPTSVVKPVVQRKVGGRPLVKKRKF